MIDTTFEDAVKDVIALFEQAKSEWSEFPLAVDYPNRQQVNLEEQTLPYVDLSFDWLTGETLDIHSDAFSRYWFSVVVAVGTKKNEGHFTAQRLLQHFADRLHLRSTPHVTLQQGRPTKLREAHGWEYRPLLVIGFFTRTRSGT